MNNETITHTIIFSKEGEKPRSQGACGKTDLLNILRAMMTDGYTEFKISTNEAEKIKR